VPAYLISLIIYLAVCAALPQRADDYEAFIKRLPYYLSFVPEYANANGSSIFIHSWAVGIELKFYLLFPLVMFLMIKGVNWRFAALAISAALLIAYGSFMAQSYCALLFGALLALGLERPTGNKPAEKLTNISVTMPVALLIALFILLRHTETLTLVALVTTYVVAYAIVQSSRVSALLTWQPLGLSGTALVWRLSASFPGYPHRVFDIRRRHDDRQLIERLLLYPCDHGCRGDDVSRNRASCDGGRSMVVAPERPTGTWRRFIAADGAT
jgi:peptidoglycan/LPS O-acetylase OafA/YrhL